MYDQAADAADVLLRSRSTFSDRRSAADIARTMLKQSCGVSTDYEKSIIACSATMGPVAAASSANAPFNVFGSITSPVLHDTRFYTT